MRLVKTLRKQPLHSVILGLCGKNFENIGTLFIMKGNTHSTTSNN